MSKFCFYCKLELDSTINSCPQCGNAVVAEIPVLPVLEPAKIKTFNYAKFNKVLFKIAGIGMAVLLILLLINIGVAISQKPEKRLSSTDKESYLKPIDTMIEGMMNEDSDKFLSAYPEYIARGFEENVDRHNATALFYIEREFGENVKITFKETSKEKIDEETLNKQEEYIKETHNEEIEISMGYKLKGEIVLEGNGKSDKIENKLWVIKIDGKWYALSRIF